MLINWPFRRNADMKRVSSRRLPMHNDGMPQVSTRYTHVESPIGPILLAGSDDSLCLTSFPTGRGRREPKTGWVEDRNGLREAVRQIEAYFAGELTEFDLNLAPLGNDFEMAVWAELEKIPYGETASYGDIATRIGQPLSASRAVGTACGANPLPIVIPCHRVVGADGSLTGFGGGLPTKRFLLDLEFRVKPPAGTLFAL